MSWNWVTGGDVSADPGSTNFNTNNTAIGSTSTIRFYSQSAFAGSWLTSLTSLVKGDTIVLVDGAGLCASFQLSADAANNDPVIQLSVTFRVGSGNWSGIYQLFFGGPQTGSQGSIGAQGAAGPQGSTGSAGSQGAQGASGSSGAQGFQGAAGAAGAQGNTGSQGSAGAQGAVGSQGSIGAQGSSGSQGVQGASGVSDQIFIGAAEMIPRVTTGSTVDSTESTTNKVNNDLLDFDQSTVQYSQACRAWPAGWNTFTATFWWTAASGSGDVVWAAQARCIVNDDPIDSAYGTAQSTTDTLTAALDDDISPATSGITPAGTPSTGAPVRFQFYRDASAGGDTLNATANLIGVLLTKAS